MLNMVHFITEYIQNIYYSSKFEHFMKKKSVVLLLDFTHLFYCLDLNAKSVTIQSKIL